MVHDVTASVITHTCLKLALYRFDRHFPLCDGLFLCQPMKQLHLCSQERHAQAVKEGGLVTYKDQLSYGVHVVVVMGVFYGIGHMAAGSFSPKPSMARPLLLCVRAYHYLRCLSA